MQFKIRKFADCGPEINAGINDVASEQYTEISRGVPVALPAQLCSSVNRLFVSLGLWNVFHICCERLFVFHLNLTNLVILD